MNGKRIRLEMVDSKSSLVASVTHFVVHGIQTGLAPRVRGLTR